MTTKLRWVIAQGSLGLLDIATTPWWDLTLEANPLVRWGKLPFMVVIKVVCITYSTWLWEWWDNPKFRRYLRLVTVGPVVLAVVWNLM